MAVMVSGSTCEVAVGPDLECTHCGRKGHQRSACWQLHPELDPRTPEGKMRKMLDWARSRAERKRAGAAHLHRGYGNPCTPQIDPIDRT